jgi:hypothetical protein
MYKTLKSAGAAKTSLLDSEGPGAAGRGESLYVVKSTEFPSRTFMMVSKRGVSNKQPGLAGPMRAGLLPSCALFE